MSYDDHCVNIIISLGLREGGRLEKRGCICQKGGVRVEKGRAIAPYAPSLLTPLEMQFPLLPTCIPPTWKAACVE